MLSLAYSEQLTFNNLHCLSGFQSVFGSHIWDGFQGVNDSQPWSGFHTYCGSYHSDGFQFPDESHR